MAIAKGNIPWNKGGHHSEASRQKMSETRNGRIPWNKGLKGCQVGWNKGLKASAETIQKAREAHAGQKPWNTGTRGIVVAWNKGMKTPDEVRKKLSQSHLESPFLKRGADNPRYIDGRSKEHEIEREVVSRSFEYKLWRSRIFKRDGYICQVCRVPSSGKLQAHHKKSFKDFPEERVSVDNGITLCESCHNKLHADDRRGRIQPRPLFLATQ